MRAQPKPAVDRTETGATKAEATQAVRPLRCVHYVGFRDDRYWNAYRIFGGPRVIHRRWDFYATRDVGPDDIVIFAQGDETQPVAERNATDLDERWL